MYNVKMLCFIGMMILVGCQAEQGVTISGGVHGAGNYAHTKGQTLDGYIALAKGYTDEAIVEDVYVVRVVPDSGNHFRSTQFSVSDSLVILPGDDIQVPVRTYDVRLDTVHAISDLRLASNGQLIRVDEGVIVPGWTEKGAVVAFIMGRGTGYTLPDTKKATSAFHYLYCLLHPDEYKRLLAFSGGVIDSLEALEDAHAVHQWLFPKQDYQTEGLAQVPPHGYFEVKQGMWLRPRTKDRPGKGMRRRQFEDGRIWMTFRDGRQRWQYPDGRVEVIYRRGKKEVRYRDGRVSHTDSQGNVKTRYRDGREVWELVSGSQSTSFPDGRLVRKSANGDVFERDVDGTAHYTFSDGTKRIDYIDGRVFVKDALGNEEMQYTDGHIVIQTPSKDEITLYPDGRQVTKKADGSVVRFESGGHIQKRHASGVVTHISADGLRNDVYPDGSRSVTKKDGTRVVYYIQGDVLESRPDGYSILRGREGSVQETFPDGRRVAQLPSGASIEVFPDGRKIHVTSIGHRIEQFPDGKQEITLRGIYDYPSPLKDEWVVLEGLPNKVAIKEPLEVRGTVVDSVLDVRVVAFGVPDGDVLTGKVHRRDGRFESVLKFKEEGHYRVQVQVGLPRLRTFTSVHHHLVVGQPDSLVPLVLPIAEYPGDALGAQVLVDRVNEARERLGRRKLKADRYLIDIANVRLREMIVKGEVSHLSKADEDVRSHMFKERVRFVTVGENVASSHFLETMHEGWMLSAGHRGNILDKRWTHIGVAVTEIAGMLWGVQIFAGW